MTATKLQQKKRAFQGRLYHCLGRRIVDHQELIDFQYYPDGLLILDEQGKVEACGNRLELAKTIDLTGYNVDVLPEHYLILPGLVDLHVHLPQLMVTARQEDNLLLWLERHIFPEEIKFSDLSYVKLISEAFFRELLQAGTTMACVFLTSHKEATQIAFETAEALGNRVVMGLNLMDQNAPEALTPSSDTLLKDTEALCHAWYGKDNGRLLYAWMPRFALSCSETLLSGIGKLRKQYPDVYLHTHISEQLDEINAVQQAFPWAKHYTDVYDHFGLLGPKTILAHGVHLKDEELCCIAQHKTGIAHCSSSNFFLKSGHFSWKRIIEKNVRFGLGSDIGAGPELSIFRTLRDAQFMQRELLSVHQLFYHATLGAAEVLHLNDRLGNFIPGKQADFILVDMSTRATNNVNCCDQSIETMLSELIYRGDDRFVQKTFVAGRQVYSKNEQMSCK